MSPKIPITVVIPVKDEERNLPSCLQRLGRFAHVVAVDSGSTDSTSEILLLHGVECVQFDWNGQYPKKRNWVLLNYPFKTDWVLFLDADEFVNDAFCDAVEAAVPNESNVGYWLNYSNYFLGKRLKHGLPQRKLALFRIGSGLYERIEERSWSGLDMEIHEHPIVDGPIGEIMVEIDHRDYRGLARFLERHLDYAKWEARRLLALNSQTDDRGGTLTDRQRFKYRHLERWWYPWFYFLYVYIVRFGLIDGRAGFFYAYYKAWYFHTIRLLIREYRTD